MSALLATALTCATIGGAGTAYEPGVNCREIQVDGLARQYLVYVPRTRPVTGGARRSCSCSTAPPATASGS